MKQDADGIVEDPPGAAAIVENGSEGIAEEGGDDVDVEPITVVRRNDTMNRLKRPKEPLVIDNTLSVMANAARIHHPHAEPTPPPSSPPQPVHKERHRGTISSEQPKKGIIRVRRRRVPRQAVKLVQRPPLRSEANCSGDGDASSASSPSPSPSSSSASSPDSSHSSSDFSDGEDDKACRIFQKDPIEEEMQNAIRKAKWLARIDQLEARGVRKSKNYTYKSSEKELLVEVARMEVIDKRRGRVQKGRTAFLTFVGGLETGMNMCDKADVLPGKFHMDGFLKATVKDITTYDDCLERAIDETIGDLAHLPWYMELSFALVPAMINHSIMQRFKHSAEHTNEVLRSNPQLRSEVARELAAQQRNQEAGMQPPAPPIANVPDQRAEIQRIIAQNADLERQKKAIEAQNQHIRDLMMQQERLLQQQQKQQQQQQQQGNESIDDDALLMRTSTTSSIDIE